MQSALIVNMDRMEFLRDKLYEARDQLSHVSHIKLSSSSRTIIVGMLAQITH